MILSNIDSMVDTGTTLVIAYPLDVSKLSSAPGGTPYPNNVGIDLYTCRF